MSSLACLTPVPPDPLLWLIEAFRSDPRPEKLDLGVGVWRDAQGRTPVLASVKEAERRLLEGQESKDYVGAAGNLAFVARMAELVFGGAVTPAFGMQAPGGTAALRLATDLLVRAGTPRIHIGRPAWPNHEPICAASRLPVAAVLTFDAARQKGDYGAFRAQLMEAGPGEALLVQASCHNPTGVDLTAEEWADLAEIAERRELVAVIDAAYLGLGEGVDADAAGLRTLAARAPASLVAVSCSKMFGLYRERTAALFVVLNDAATATKAVTSNLLAISRATWSMPPDHGASVVQAILEDEALKSRWLDELDGMRERIVRLRHALAERNHAGAVDLAAFARQKGMFSLLGLSQETMRALREESAVYLAPGGRLNVAGLNEEQIPALVAALEKAVPA